MALACNQNHVAFPVPSMAGRFDRLRPVRNAERTVPDRQHVRPATISCNDRIRFLESEDCRRSGSAGRSARAASFAIIGRFPLSRLPPQPTTVITLAVAVQHLMDAVQHVRQGVRRMGIIHDRRISSRRDWIVSKPPGNRMQGRSTPPDTSSGSLPNANGSTIHSQQVICIETADKASRSPPDPLTSSSVPSKWDSNIFPLKSANVRKRVGQLPG